MHAGKRRARPPPHVPVPPAANATRWRRARFFCHVYRCPILRSTLLPFPSACMPVRSYHAMNQTSTPCPAPTLPCPRAPMPLLFWPSGDARPARAAVMYHIGPAHGERSTWQRSKRGAKQDRWRAVQAAGPGEAEQSRKANGALAGATRALPPRRPYLGAAAAAAWAPLPLLLRMNRTWSTSALKL